MFSSEIESYQFVVCDQKIVSVWHYVEDSHACVDILIIEVLPYDICPSMVVGEVGQVVWVT